MSEGKGVSMPSCPIGFKACYPSFECQDCMFWRNDKCDYEAIVASEESVAQTRQQNVLGELVRERQQIGRGEPEYKRQQYEEGEPVSWWECSG